MKLTYSTAALFDMDSAAEAIQGNSQQAALRFLDAVEKTAERLVDFPEFGAIYETTDPELQNLRACLVGGFEKYILFYRLTGDEVTVTRVIHGHRNIPEVFKDRP